MGGEVRMDYGGVALLEAGLPSFDDLTPLSQSLIPLELAWAFKISPEAPRSILDVNRASDDTLSSLFRDLNLDSLNKGDKNHVMGESDGPELKKSRRMDNFTDETETETETETAKALKRPRLVWTPQLHKRFLQVVAYLGLKKSMPKTIMQLMNVEGLTRENVASHLQKYRLYVKRIQRSSNEGPSPSDHLFSSMPIPRHSSNEASCNEDMNYGGAPLPQPPIMGILPMMAKSASGYESAQSYHQNHFLQQNNNIMMNGQ